MILKNKEIIFEEKKCRLRDGSVLPLLVFRKFNGIPGIRHCFTTRKGGVSRGIFSSLNLSFTRGDDVSAVEKNYAKVAEALKSDCAHMIVSDQTHTINVKRVEQEDAGKGVVRPKDYSDVDGLITNVPGLILGTFFADCVPLYFVDPVHRAIGLSHSGWRGTVNKMGAVTIEAMERSYGTRPEDVICGIGPSICRDCYQVGADVIGKFQENFGTEANVFFRPDTDGKYRLDLWKANEQILLQAGVRPENIAVTNLCTCCNPDILFSHRASHGKRGNLGAFLMLTEETEIL